MSPIQSGQIYLMTGSINDPRLLLHQPLVIRKERAMSAYITRAAYHHHIVIDRAR
jgi:hypothetical protein